MLLICSYCKLSVGQSPSRCATAPFTQGGLFVWCFGETTPFAGEPNKVWDYTGAPFPWGPFSFAIFDMV